MNFSTKINIVRRSLMRNLTKNKGNSFVDKEGNSKLGIKRILICRPNKRLGNLLLITPLVEEVIETFPDCKIDLFVNGFLAPIVFKNYENINLIFTLPKKPFEHLLNYFQVWLSLKKQKYDLVINIDVDSSSGRLATQFSNSRNKFFGEAVATDQLKKEDQDHFAKSSVYNLRNYFAQLGVEVSNKAIAPLNLKLSTSELAEGKTIVSNLVNNDKKTISIFTFATGDKCYSPEWWGSFYEKLKNEFQEYNIIEILPVENVSQIDFEAPTFYSKDVREMGAVIANTEMFIGADSGVMHLASSTLTPTLGLFSVTDLKKYGPYDNQSSGINTNENSIDECVKLAKTMLSKIN